MPISPALRKGRVLDVLKGESPKTKSFWGADFALFLLWTPANAVVKQSDFNNREGKGADHGVGSRSLAMCCWHFLSKGGGLL